MKRYYTHWMMVTLLGAVTGCASLDQYGSGSPNYSGNNNSNNYPYGAYGTRYPSNGYETEYRKAQQNINSQNSQAIMNDITQRMLNSGWYPESTTGNQLVFTRVREPNDQKVYYKTVYTLVPSTTGYAVHANMKLKTMDNPYNGSLDQAARNVDDNTENLLKSVKKSVEQKSTSVTPVPTIVPMVSKPFESSFKPTPSNLPVVQKLPTHYEATSTPYAQPMNAPTRAIPTALPTKIEVPVEQSTDDQVNSINKQQKAQKENEQLKEMVTKNKKDKHKSKNDAESTEDQSIDTNTNVDQVAPQ